MTLREIINYWKAGSAPEAVRSLLWENWGEVSRAVAVFVHDSVSYQLPDDTDEAFREIFADIAAEQSILAMEAEQRTGQATPVNVRMQRIWADLETIRPFGDSEPQFGSSYISSTVTGRWASNPNIPEGVRRVGGGIYAALGPTEFIGEFPRREPSPRAAAALNSMVESLRDLPLMQIVPHQRQQTVEEAARLRNRNFGLRYGVGASMAAELLAPWNETEQPRPDPVLECFELQEGEELEIVARSTRNVSPKVKKKAYGDPIYTWGLLSSKPRNGGEHITYEVRLEDDGSIRCNCPGWVFMKKGAQRSCKHTREVELEAKDFFKKHGNGEQLPTTLPTFEQAARLKSNKKTESKVGSFGRILDFD